MHAHLAGESDGYVEVGPLLKLVRDWKGFLQSAPEEGVGGISDGDVRTN